MLRGRNTLFLAVGVVLVVVVGLVAARYFAGLAPPTATLLEVSGQVAFDEGAAAKAAAVAGVAKVEKYLAFSREDHAVIGVEPGAALRFVSGNQLRLAERIEAGRAFEAGDSGQRVAILGLPPAGMGGMAGMTEMAIPSDIGASFELAPGVRLRVIGRFTLPRDVTEHFIFLPLDVAQTVYGYSGQVSHLFLTLDPSADRERVKRDLQAALGTGITITER